MILKLTQLVSLETEQSHSLPGLPAMQYSSKNIQTRTLFHSIESMPGFFRESQRFRQFWLWTLLIGVLMIFLWGIVQQIVLKQPYGDNPLPDWGLLAFTMVPLGLMYFFYRIQLITEVREDGITLRYWPFGKKFIRKEDIASAQVIQYKPLLEYGGWGVKLGKHGLAWSVAGNHGLQLTLKDGSQFLVGTQSPEALQSAIETLETGLV